MLAIARKPITLKSFKQDDLLLSGDIIDDDDTGSSELEYKACRFAQTWQTLKAFSELQQHYFKLFSS